MPTKEKALLAMGVQNWKPGKYLVTVGDLQGGIEREVVSLSRA